MKKLFVSEKWQWSPEYQSTEKELKNKSEILYLLEKR
jgi:hypothetical protein